MIAALLFFACAATASQAHPVPNRPIDRANHGNDRNQSTNPDPRDTSKQTSPVVPRINSANGAQDQEAVTTADKRQTSEQIVGVSRLPLVEVDTSTIEYVQVILTVVWIGVTVAGARIAYLAFKAEAAAVQLSGRAYVSVVFDGRATFQDANNVFSGTVSFVNKGTTPAYEVELEAAARIVKSPIPDDFDFTLSVAGR